MGVSGIIERGINGVNAIRNYVADRRQKSVDRRVQQAAIEAFTTLAISLAFQSGLAYAFAATTLSGGIVHMAVLGMIIQLAIEVARYVGERMGWLNASPRLSKGLDKAVLAKCHRVSLFNAINCLGEAGVNTLIHECGHALMGLALVKNCQPTIKIFPFRGGYTKFKNVEQLTAVGALLGVQNAALLIILGGVIASTAWALGEFALASSLADRYPQLSECLRFHGVSQLLGDIFYGVASFLDPEAMESGDFIKAYNNSGIHPLSVVAVMIALPIIQKVWLESGKKTARSRLYSYPQKLWQTGKRVKSKLYSYSHPQIKAFSALRQWQLL